MAFKLKVGAAADCPTYTRSDVEVQGHTLIVDEPIERGGTGLGATPLEFLVAALAGCTNVISNRLAQEMGIEIVSMTVDVVAALDARVLAEEAVNPAFPEVRVAVGVISPDDEVMFAQLSERLRLACPISVLFTQAGTKMVHEWTVTHPGG